jgi:hypothetical protein
MKRSITTRKLGLEQCESRQMLAGNVDVDVNFGDLTISGDGAANGVQIAQARNAAGAAILGSYVISGFNQGGAPTTINGQAGAVIVNGVNDDVQVSLQGGNDNLRTASIGGRHLFADDLTVNMGEGNNTLRLDNISVRDDVSVFAGSGADTVLLRGIVGNTAANPDADLSISTGSGADTVVLFNFFVRDSASIDTGFGNFADTVNLITGNVGQDVSIFTRDGSDSVAVQGVGVNDDLFIDTAGGRDSLLITDSQVDELFAFMGTDDDRVSMGNTFGRRATLSGGFGADTLSTSNVAFSELFSANSF